MGMRGADVWMQRRTSDGESGKDASEMATRVEHAPRGRVCARSGSELPRAHLCHANVPVQVRRAPGAVVVLASRHSDGRGRGAAGGHRGVERHVSRGATARPSPLALIARSAPPARRVARPGEHLAKSSSRLRRTLAARLARLRPPRGPIIDGACHLGDCALLDAAAASSASSASASRASVAALGDVAADIMSGRPRRDATPRAGDGRRRHRRARATVPAGGLLTRIVPGDVPGRRWYWSRVDKRTSQNTT